MPTNYLRGRGTPRSGDGNAVGRGQIGSPDPVARLTIGTVSLTAIFDATGSAQRILAALPLHSSAETWGEAIHFELPIRGGRDRTARLNAEVGGLYYWAEEQRIILIFGATPISGNGVLRLPRPCNVLGRVEGDLTALKRVHPGQKVVMLRA